MVVLYAASQFLTQRMMLAKNTNLDKSMPNPMMQSQKIMLDVMPIGMLFFGLSVQIGVVLYLMTTNVWTIGQQFYTLRNSPVPGSQAEQEMIARRKAKEAKKALAAAGNGPVSNAVPAADGKAQDRAPVSHQRVQPVRSTRRKRKK
jgi:YidC/Oxa1 family membrane protein insertase